MAFEFELPNPPVGDITQAFGEDVYRGWAKLAENQVQVLVWEGDFADGGNEFPNVDILVVPITGAVGSPTNPLAIK